MALNTSKCNHLIPVHFKGLKLSWFVNLNLSWFIFYVCCLYLYNQRMILLMCSLKWSQLMFDEARFSGVVHWTQHCYACWGYDVVLCKVSSLICHFWHIQHVLLPCHFIDILLSLPLSLYVLDIKVLCWIFKLIFNVTNWHITVLAVVHYLRKIWCHNHLVTYF